MIERDARDVTTLLDKITVNSLTTLEYEADRQAPALRKSLDELRQLRNRILGSSERPGLLELTLVDRAQRWLS